MTRYEAIEKALRKFVAAWNHAPPMQILEYLANAYKAAEAALALPEDGKVVNAELYENVLEIVQDALRYIELREASGEPMPYKIIRDGDKVRFE